MPKKVKSEIEVSEQEIDEWFEEEETSETDIENTELQTEKIETLFEKYSKIQLKISQTSTNFLLSSLKSQLNDPNFINLEPDYQRKSRWDNKKKSQLIESLIINIPIPPLYLFEHAYSRFEVMDGRQRLETIRGFLNNEFKLTGLDIWKELNGKTYFELNEVIKTGILRRNISAVILNTETTQAKIGGLEIRMILFKRLNTGGIKLNAQEIRNAIYSGRFNEVIKELALSEAFRKAWGMPQDKVKDKKNIPSNLIKNNIYKSMADCELVLRFFAIKETVKLDLKGSLSKLLNTCMENHANISEEEIKKLKASFYSSLEKLVEIFDDKIFRLPKGKLSPPLYDSLMVACDAIEKNNFDSKKNIISSLASAFENQRHYNILVGRGNTVKAIKERVNLAQKILTGNF